MTYTIQCPDPGPVAPAVAAMSDGPTGTEIPAPVEPTGNNATFSLVRAISGTLVIVGLVFAFFERRFPPNTLLLENSPDLPEWVGWAGYLFSLVAAVAYNLTDYAEWWARRRQRANGVRS